MRAWSRELEEEREEGERTGEPRSSCPRWLEERRMRSKDVQSCCQRSVRCPSVLECERQRLLKHDCCSRRLEL